MRPVWRKSPFRAVIGPAPEIFTATAPVLTQAVPVRLSKTDHTEGFVIPYSPIQVFIPRGSEMAAMKVSMKVSTKTIVKEPKTRDVMLTILETDYNHVWLEAQSHNETVSDWISRLVNTALQP